MSSRSWFDSSVWFERWQELVFEPRVNGEKRKKEIQKGKRGRKIPAEIKTVFWNSIFPPQKRLTDYTGHWISVPGKSLFKPAFQLDFAAVPQRETGYAELKLQMLSLILLHQFHLF